MYSLFVEVLKRLRQELTVEDAKIPTLTGLKPTRNDSNRFLVDCVNHSDTLSSIIAMYPWWGSIFIEFRTRSHSS